MLTRELERSAFYRDRVPALFKQAWVFVYVCFAWIFFRALSLSDALADRPPNLPLRLGATRGYRR